MLKDINPILPMRNKALTKEFYLSKLSFKELGDYGDYFIVGKDNIEIHFFKFNELEPKKTTDKCISGLMTLINFINC